MLLVILGAGASFDSIPSLPPSAVSIQYLIDQGRDPGRQEFRPPLADQLFASTRLNERLQRQFPTLFDVVDQLARRGTDETVEDVLHRLDQESERYPRRLRQLMAVRLYIRELIFECERQWSQVDALPTNHISLLDRIEQVRGESGPHPTFVTFNYDRLVESALEYRGQHTKSLAAYVSPDRTRLLKLHGSVDWVRPMCGRPPSPLGSRMHAAEYLIETAPGKPELGDIELLGNLSLTLNDGRVCAPALALPYRGKQFECPPEQLKTLDEVLPQARGILTIGWSAGEEHFLSKLVQGSRPDAVVQTVSGNQSASVDTLNRLKSAGMSGNALTWRPFDRGFSDYVRSSELTTLLHFAMRRQ